ncbi:MAG TPA: serine hydrolase domain-containing protein [Nitrososphaeraceae archaeon]|nr:serine hydrolase domain-containing protein [Nitrososphaeraceae archaeon]
MTPHNAKAQQPAALSSNFSSSPSLNETNPNAITITVNNAEEVISESYNTISNGSEGNLSAVLLNQIVKPTVLESMGNKSRGGVSIVVGVITPNGTSVSGYGNISKADSTKVNGDTIFEIGSFTKTFTAALLADMAKRGIVNLDDPIEKYLPSNNVTVPSYNGHKITLENLATHTSGLPDIPQLELDNRTLPTQQAYNIISNSSFVSEPGTRYSYSNIGVGLLGHALSLKAGIPYEQLVRDRILNVLGMNSTGIILNVLGMNSTGIAMNSTQITTPHPDLLKAKAKGHLGGKEISHSILPEIIVPTGAAYSSANDLLKYLSANMGLIDTKINDILQDTHLIRHPSTTAYFNQTALPSITHDLMDVYNGLVWEIYTNLGGKDTVVSKDGGVDGYSTFVMFNPTKQIGLVVLCSCDGPDISAALLGRLLYLWIRAVPVSDS